MGKNKKGFTLIELLTATLIMVALLCLGLPTMLYHYKNAKSKKAKSQVIRVETAIEAYKNDMGNYPSVLFEAEYFGNTSTDKSKRASIIQALTGYDKNKNKISSYWDDSNWHGPYLEVKPKEIDASGQMIDPWQNPFLFDATLTGRSLQNESSVDIISIGPDEEWDSNNQNSPKNDDNVYNWGTKYLNN